MYYDAKNNVTLAFANMQSICKLGIKNHKGVNQQKQHLSKN